VKKFPILFVISLLACLLHYQGVSAQSLRISGQVLDSSDSQSLIGATVLLTRPSDTATVVGGASTDSSGNFRLDKLNPGPYRIKITYTGYKAFTKRIFLADSSIQLGTVFLVRDGILMKTATITDMQDRVKVNGDTTQFNANAFKTNPDATAEDLLKKMPGVTSENGTTKVNGEEVKKVMVDGKPYFGDDPNAALKSIPADMVDQVQVYDQSSDQSRFTGFDDGKSSKTINIVTKKGMANGQFGKVYAGYGTADRYNTGLTLNVFNNDQRLTVLGMSNNINQQNFSMQDLSGAFGASGMMRGGSGRGPVRGPAAGFMVGNQTGLTTTHAFGMNFSDDWGTKMKFSGSYFFNYSDNAANTTLNRNYFTINDSTLVYDESNRSSSLNINHRLNFRWEYNIDSMNALIIAPKITYQFTDFGKFINGQNLLQENVIQSKIVTTNGSINDAWNASGNITYRHRFRKLGRSFSIDINSGYNNRIGSGFFYSNNEFLAGDTTTTEQYSKSVADGYNIAPTLIWTESMGKKIQWQFSYAYSTTISRFDKNTFHYNEFLEQETDTALTNLYGSVYTTNRVGSMFKYNGEKAQLTIGIEAQQAILISDQRFPSEFQLKPTFKSILPNASYNYKFGKGKNLKITYRTNTNAPTITQLQSVLDNSNPLQLRIGNPNLKQNYEHTLMTHYGRMNMEKATGLFIFLYTGLTQNYVSNSTFIAAQDTTIDGIFLNKGSQLIRQANLNGYATGRTFITYSIPLKKLKSNLGLNAFASYLRTPALINDQLNIAQTTSLGPGFTFSSNVSEKLDFTLSYSGNYNLVKNSIQTQSNNNYFTHTASFKFNWIFYKGFVWNTSLDQTFYSGLGTGFNTNFLLWNSSLGYKFFKNKSLEVKVSVFDLLKQNASVARSITETYVEDTRSNTLQQYYMLTVTWNIKHFKEKPAEAGTNPPAGEHSHPTGSGGSGGH
jgi:Outer membrane protein beta-barrel family/Carboxypeptidase regulatory-like domain